MKIKRSISILLIILMAAALSGCQLAREDAAEGAGNDRLVGVFVTSEYLDLFDFEGYLNDNLQNFSGGEITLDGNGEQYQGRLYAVLQDRTLTSDSGKQSTIQEFVFPDVDGITYFAAKIPATDESESFISSGSDEAISDGHVGLSYGDEEDKITLDGTIYLSPSSDQCAFYVNPVYQTKDGSVYAVSGNGMEMSGIQDEGMAMSQTLDESTVITENGKSKTMTTSVKISFSLLLPPETVVVLQMDSDSNAVSRVAYTPSELPDTLKPETATAYILVETYKHDASGAEIVTRELFSSQNETMTSFYARSDGVCVKQWTTLEW